MSRDIPTHWIEEEATNLSDIAEFVESTWDATRREHFEEAIRDSFEQGSASFTLITLKQLIATLEQYNSAVFGSGVCHIISNAICSHYVNIEA